jgi:hypothetical protein
MHVSSAWPSLLLACILIIGCKSAEEEKQAHRPVDRESLLAFNQEKASIERAFIDSLVAVHHDASLPHYRETSTGLRMWTERVPADPGVMIQVGDTVQWVGQLMLTDSTLLMEWPADAPFRFIWNRSEWPAGFQEIAGFLGRGDSAECLIPSHLGWGLTGMPPLIPQDAVLWLRIQQLSGPEKAQRPSAWNALIDRLEAGGFPESDWIEAKSMAASPCLAWYESLPGYSFSAPPEIVRIDLRTMRMRSEDGVVMDLGQTSWDFNVNDGGQLLPVLADLHRLYPQPRKWACWCPVHLAFESEISKSAGFGPEDVVGFQWEMQTLQAPVNAQ